MKKIILLFAATFLFTINAYASTLEREFIDNVWSFHYRGGRVWTYGQLNIKHIDGKIGYCIEPDSAVNTNEYSMTNDWSASTYSNDIKTQMELIAYYGYHYPGHRTIKYYMATQELIWLFSEDERILWTKEDHSDSEAIDITNEKNEIMSLVNKHNLLPSIAGATFTYQTGNNVPIKDTNGVLNSYEANNITINNNSFSVEMDDKPKTITFNQKKNSYNETIVYLASIRSQRVATFSNPNLNSFQITLSPTKVTFNLIKRDKDTSELIIDEGIKIKLTNTKYNESTEYEFKKGKIKLRLFPGKYMIEELSSSNNYMINDECQELNVDYSLPSEVNYYNEKVRGKIRIKKTDENNNPLSDCIFKIYNSNNELVDTIKTTNLEYVESKLLSLGKYYVKEETSKYGYKVDSKTYEVELKYIDEKTIPIEDIVVKNEKIICAVTVIGEGSDGSDLEIEYDLYDEKNNLVYSGNKKQINLEYGNYYLKETKVPNGYKINDEKVVFTVSDKSCNSNLTVLSEKINMPITTTKNSFIIASLIIIINLGIYIYVKKKH